MSRHRLEARQGINQFRIFRQLFSHEKLIEQNFERTLLFGIDALGWQVLQWSSIREQDTVKVVDVFDFVVSEEKKTSLLSFEPPQIVHFDFDKFGRRVLRRHSLPELDQVLRIQADDAAIAVQRAVGWIICREKSCDLWIRREIYIVCGKAIVLCHSEEHVRIFNKCL